MTRGQLRFGQRTLVRATAGITLLFGLGATACTGPQASPTPAPSAGQVAPLVVQPIEERDARWVLLPERSEPSVALPYDRGTTAFITNGLRVLESPAGSLERAAERLPGSNTKVLPLPAHLGQGFLFHSDLEAETVLWRAESWTGELRPLARLPERARQVSIGFDRVFALLRDSYETVAVDLDTGALTDLGPLPPSPSYLDLMFWDEWFAVAHTDVRGVVATFDAGTSWHVTGLSEAFATFDLHRDGIIVERRPSKDLLRPDGSWSQLDMSEDDPFAALVANKLGLELAQADVNPGRPHPLGRRPLEAAVLHGWPLNETQAVLAVRGSVGTVDLESGTVQDVRRHAYPGAEPCAAVSLGEGVGFVCQLSDGTTGIYQLNNDLSLLQLAALPPGRLVRSSGNGHLVIQGPCPTPDSEPTPTVTAALPVQAGDKPHGESLSNAGRKKNAAADSQEAKQRASRRAYCIHTGMVDARPNSKQVFVSGDLGAERVVSLKDGRVAILVPPRFGTPGNLTLLDGAKTEVVKLRFAKDTGKKMRSMVESGLWLQDPTQFDSDTIGTWVAGANRLVGVMVTLDGIIRVATRGEADLRRTQLSGRRAIESSSGESAWQTLDYGQTWTQIDAPRGLNATSNRRQYRVGCAEVGCSLGDWLRVGYRIEQTETAQTQATPTQVTPTQPTSVPRDAAVPETLNLRPSGYSQWGFTCYPTGEHSGSRGSSAEKVLAASRQPPRHGGATGFLSTPLAAPATGADIANSANRPFLGIPKPRNSAGGFAFDMGADAAHQFRAYTWGQDGEAWPRTGGWVVRVADRFAVEGLWSNAPTRVPWPSILHAAHLFGADRANRYASSWQLSLDPSERAGVLRVTNTGTTELHFIEQDRPALSLGNMTIGSVSGVVKVRGVWHFGSQDGARFHVFQVAQGKLVPVGDYPLGEAVHASLVRDVDATRLAILLRAPVGTWHIYPLTENAEAEEPLALSREQLNSEWPHCDPEERGWLVVGSLPFSRFTPSGGSGLLGFEGTASAWRAEAVTARAVVSRSNMCVQALAARLASNVPPAPLMASTPPVAQSIPLTLTDRLHDVRYAFQCAP